MKRAKWTNPQLVIFRRVNSNVFRMIQWVDEYLNKYEINDPETNKKYLRLVLDSYQQVLKVLEKRCE